MPKLDDNRRTRLVQVFNETNGKCLHGHNYSDCPDKSHDFRLESKLERVAIPKIQLCLNSSGNYILNRSGLRDYLEVYTVVKYQAQYLVKDNLRDWTIKKLLDNWTEYDRQEKNADWKSEYEIRHKLQSDRQYPLTGRFSGVAKDIFYDSQPVFYLEAICFDAIRSIPIAKIRLASRQEWLLVDLPKNLFSKLGLRKAIRYNKIAKTVQTIIDNACLQAVKTHILYFSKTVYPD